MTDIATVWIIDQVRGDWVLLPGGVLQSDQDLVTSVLISLFTDRVALPDDVIPDGTGDPRGWWADDTEYPIGSRLWLLSRSKLTDQTLNDAKSYCEEALQWLIDDQVVASVDVVTEKTSRSMLGAQVTLFKTDGTKVSLKFEWAWSTLN